MPDVMDRCQQHNADLHADAEAAHRRAQAQANARPVRTTCANLDCGEAIAPARQALHAQLCLGCQRAEEGAAAHLAVWRGR